ncbi:hypothetical protein B0T10DRAFT_488231 [Thelonectria olida]|uniref:Uncharacterized protein n=1 Tax=Thelonectria olida TaxID=1576542 RepID=A0A9P9APD2_9HYPO|nr:hypothetical protein B0T10DRAFT_488231 [Thelonectria olida]
MTILKNPMFHHERLSSSPANPPVDMIDLHTLQPRRYSSPAPTRERAQWLVSQSKRQFPDLYPSVFNACSPCVSSVPHAPLYRYTSHFADIGLWGNDTRLSASKSRRATVRTRTLGISPTGGSSCGGALLPSALKLLPVIVLPNRSSASTGVQGLKCARTLDDVLGDVSVASWLLGTLVFERHFSLLIYRRESVSDMATAETTQNHSCM